MEACLMIGGVLLALGVIAAVVAVVRLAQPAAGPAGHSPHRRAARGRFEYCPSCDARLFPDDRDCPCCGLDLDGALAWRLERVQIARAEIRRLREADQLDPETADRVTEQLARRKQLLLRPEEPAGRAPAPRSRPRAEAPPPLPARDPLVGERPPGLPDLAGAESVPATPGAPPRGRLGRLWGPGQPAETGPSAPSAPRATPRAAAPRRPLAETLGKYMAERNILWGELAGGVLIVGCSIALVLSLWRTLEELPYFTFLLFSGITAAVFGAGEYTLHHWKLTATSRGLLVIALLLAPLNLLLLADPGARGMTTAIDTAVKVAAVLAFAGLVRTAGRDLAGTDALPGRVPRRWLLALAVVGPPASQMVPAAADAGLLRYVPVWLALACFAAPSGLAVVRLSREQRRAGTEPLGERPAVAVLLFVGLGLFALFCAWGFLLARPGDLPATLRHLALPAVLAGVPVLSAGLLVQRRVTEPVGLRATGTGVALAGMMVLFASLVLAWPDPGTLLATSAAVALLLGWIAFRDELPWMYAGAIPSAAVAVVLAYYALTGSWAIPEGVDPGRWLAGQMTAAPSGGVLVGFALLLGLASEGWVRRGRAADARGYAIGAAGVAAAGLLLVTVHGIERPALSAWAHAAAAIGFLAASFRWRFRAVAQVGVWLVLLASLWTLWAAIPHDRAAWGLAVGLESLALALVAVGLGFAEEGKRLRDAGRDVAAAAAALAPLLSLGAVPTSSVHTAMLFAVAASALVLASLYRAPAVTWVGSLTALVAVGHWLAFPAGLQPWHGAVLLGLLIHATVATTAALVLATTRRAGVRNDPDGGRIGPLTRLRPPGEAQPLGLYAEPLRLSGRLTAALALPLLLVPGAGLAAAWVGLSVWAGGLWLIAAVVWRERGAFSVFQAALTWAAGVAGFAWVEHQGWFPGPFGAVDPRALQAYGVAVGLLSVAWIGVRQAVRSAADLRELWAELRPSVDQVVLGGLVVGQLLLAGVGVLPAVFAELTPAGSGPGVVPAAGAAHFWGPGAWVVLAVLVVAVVAYLRWPATETESATAPLVGLTLLALTAPFLVAGAFAPDLAAASALRWGLAAVFLAGSAVVACRERIGQRAGRVGFRCSLDPYGPAWLRGLLDGAASIVLLLTAQVAWLGFTGQAPTGPAAGSVFARMGWTASVVVPLGALVVGLAVTALRERSAGYAFAGGWVWTATIAGGYALGVVTAGGALTPAELMRVGLLAIAGAAVWALAWLAVEGRVPGKGLLTGHAIVGLAGITALAAVPLGLLFLVPGDVLGPASARLGQEGWAALLLAAGAALWHAHRAAPAWRLHVIGLAVVLAADLAGCAAAAWDLPGKWLSVHVLAVGWAVAGSGMAAVLLAHPPDEPARPRLRDRLWPELFAAGLVLLGLRGGWTDPMRPLAPTGMIVVAAILFGAVALRTRSRPHEYLSGALVALAAGLVWLTWGPARVSSLALALAVGLSQAGLAWAAMALAWRAGSGPQRDDDEPDYPADDLLGLPRRSREVLPPFPHFAAAAALGLVLYGLFPALAGTAPEFSLLAWGAIAATAVVLAILVWDRHAPYSAAGLYVLGVAAVGLGLAEVRPGLVWLDRDTPLVLAAYVLGASLIGAAVNRHRSWLDGLHLPQRAPGEAREWLVFAQTVVAGAVLAMAVRTAVSEPELVHRLFGPLAVLVLGLAAARLVPLRPGFLRPATLVLGATTLAVLAWALPDPAGPVPWLHRHGGLFVALAAAAVVYTFTRASGSWAAELRRVGASLGAAAVVVLGMFLVQQIPHFDTVTRTTPLDPAAVFAPIAAIVALMVVAIRLALRPDRDPLGPTPHGRSGYVYLAELLLVFLFVHVRLNVPQVFRAEAVKYWTFIVMLLAFVGVGLAEWFARRGLRVLARPLLRTGVFLPLIPLVAFWAKPPALVTEFAETQAPGLQPMLGYLKNLPQHFQTYALLWFLAGLLYGLIALNRRSFGWALLGALATNAGLWALLTHHQVPAAVHPQAWAIPLALIILVSEHVNRYRLQAETAAGLRYLGISMIYVSSAADLFIAGVGQSLWLPVVLAALCLAGVVAGVLLRVRAFLYLGIGFLFLDVFSMIWHAAVDRRQTWVWYASGIVLGAIILAVFAVLEKRRNDVRELVGRLREWNA